MIEGSGSVTGSDPVVDNLSAQVVDNLGADVITYGFARTSVNTTTKFLCSYPESASYKFTFAECFSVLYYDWVKLDDVGSDYTSYVTTGYRVKTQGQRRFQSNYLFVFSDLSDLDETSAYTFQALWNYGTSGDTGEWTQKQTISQASTHEETNYDASRRKLKVRGSGTAVQFKFSSVAGEPFHLIGWAVYDTANSQV